MYEIYEKLLKIKGVKSSDISKATGISNMTLSDWKNGKSTPKPDKLSAIADYFGVTIDFLMGKTEQIECSECGQKYNPLDSDSVNAHIHVHDMYKKALAKYGFCYSFEECRQLETEAINVLTESGSGYISVKELKKNYIKYLKSDFSFVLRKNHFNSIPFSSFEEYARIKIQDDLHEGFMTHDLLVSLAEEFELDLQYLDGNDELLARASKNKQLMRILAYAEKLYPDKLDLIEIQLKALAEQNNKE